MENFTVIWLEAKRTRSFKTKERRPAHDEWPEKELPSKNGEKKKTWKILI